jgi:hypothetical protein
VNRRCCPPREPRDPLKLADTKELSWQAFDLTGSVSLGRMPHRHANGTTLMT